MAKTVKALFGPKQDAYKVGNIVHVADDKPLCLDCGKEISNFPVAYQSYGTLNEDKSNAILVFHGLTGDQYLAGKHPVTGKDGWWEHLVGSGKLLDTDRYFVICANVLGGCLGSYGPKDLNPETDQPFGLDFPVITIGDMVKAQKLLIEHLGIDKLFCVIGGSMGGMLVLEWVSQYPDSAFGAVTIATASQHNAQNIAFHEIGRQAIMADPEWDHGKYTESRRFPSSGLAVARMTAHVTYLSEDALQRKFGRQLQDRPHVTYGFEADFQVESYLRHQGFTFVDRFDPNSYLYITRAMDYYDLAAQHKGKLALAFKNCHTKFCIISFSSDWLFTTDESKRIVHALNAARADVSFVEVETDKGHDAFLLNEPNFFETLSGFIDRLSKLRGL